MAKWGICASTLLGTREASGYALLYERVVEAPTAGEAIVIALRNLEREQARPVLGVWDLRVTQLDGEANG
jgi:hypothetical protein